MCRCGAPVSPVTVLPVLPEPSLSPQTTERAAPQPALSAREQHENRKKERECKYGKCCICNTEKLEQMAKLAAL